MFPKRPTYDHVNEILWFEDYIPSSGRSLSVGQIRLFDPGKWAFTVSFLPVTDKPMKPTV
ncbi:MAG: hypothetical protein AAFX53_16385 [Bacteroidota bacterium]